MPRTEVRAIAQESQGNITVLIHLNLATEIILYFQRCVCCHRIHILVNRVKWRLRQDHKGDCIFPRVIHLPFSVKWLEASPSVEGLVVAGSERWSLANVLGSVRNKRNVYLSFLWNVVYDVDIRYSGTHSCSHQSSGLHTSNHFQGSPKHLQEGCQEGDCNSEKIPS